MMQVSKRIPFEDPSVLIGVRVVYITSNVLIAAVYLYIMFQINKKKGTWTRPCHTPGCASPLSGSDSHFQT